MAKKMKEFMGDSVQWSPFYRKRIKPGEKMPMDEKELDKPAEWWEGKGWKPCASEKPKAAKPAKTEEG